jgi:dCMP deaminase
MRPSWDEYFFRMARVAASRSTCFRFHVGAVIVRGGKKIVSTGYNGAPQFQKNCAEMGFCYRDRHKIKHLQELDKCRAIGSHAESNAICLAAKDGSSTENCVIYIWGHIEICPQCRAMISNSGIKMAMIKKPDGEILRYNVEDWTIHPVDDPHFYGHKDDNDD